MGRPFLLEIAESQEKLEKDLKQVRTASSKERLQMLSLIGATVLLRRRT